MVGPATGAAIRCIAFDFDGTLVDSNRIKRETFFDVVAAAGGSAVVMERVLGEAPGDRDAIFRQFVARSPGLVVAGGIDPAATLCAEYTRRCEEAIANCPPIRGAEQLLADLPRRGIVAALISATPAAPLEAVVDRRGWRSAFGYVIGNASDKAVALRRLAVLTGLTANQIVMVGDRQIDKAGAENFGCRFVAVIGADSDFTARPELTASDLAALPRLLQLGSNRP